MGNSFNIQVLADGSVKVVSPGGFSKEVHAEADEFIALMKALAGGECDTKQNKPNLANPHGHTHGHGHHHKH